MRMLGLDIDGIIADTDKLLRTYLKKVFGMDIKREQITSFYYEDCLGLNDEQMSLLWQVFYDDDAWYKLECVEGVLSALNNLKKYYEFIIISSRPENLDDVTRKWFSKHKINYKDLIVTSKKKKSEIIKEKKLKLDYFVEDRFDFADDILTTGTDIILYDYPWNRGYKGHEKVKKVSNWKEIEDILLKNKINK